MISIIGSFGALEGRDRSDDDDDDDDDDEILQEDRVGFY